MYISIDFESDEAIYQQLCRQIILEIAGDSLQEGDSLPSVRDMADEIGVNMHTVNKAYNILKGEGFLTVDRRHGAVVYIDAEKERALEELKEDLSMAVAKARVRKISREEAHAMIDKIWDAYENKESM